MLNRLEESSIIRLLLEIMGAVSTFGRYRPYRARIVGACYVARTMLYAGLSSIRRPGTCIMGRGTGRIYPLGRLPTHPFRVLGFAARGKKTRGFMHVEVPRLYLLVMTTVKMFGELVSNIFLTRMPLHVKISLLDLVCGAKKSHSMDRERCLLTVSFAMPTAAR